MSNSNRLFFVATGAVAALIFAALPARAQSLDTIMENSMATQNAYMTSHINNLEIDYIVRGKAHHDPNYKSDRPGPRPPRRSSRGASPATTTYTASPAITQGLRDQLIATVKQTAPKEGDALRKILTQYNFVDIWSTIVAPYGLKRGDAADALASYLVLGWTVVNNVPNATPAQASGARNQIKAALGTNPSFTRLSAAQKQQMAEGVMLDFVFLHAAVQKAARSGDAAQSKTLADQFQALAQAKFGVNLRGATLTGSGFAAR